MNNVERLSNYLGQMALWNNVDFSPTQDKNFNNLTEISRDATAWKHGWLMAQEIRSSQEEGELPLFHGFGHYAIPDNNWAIFAQKIVDLNKKVEKLGSEKIDYHRIGEIVRPHPDFQEEVLVFHEIVLWGGQPKFEGWEFVATLDHQYDATGDLVGNLIKKSPRFQLELGDGVDAEAFRQRDSYCDHCNTNRKRNATYLVTHPEKGMMQVGSSCLKDFLGHANPHAIAEWLEGFYALIEWISDSEDDRSSSDKIYYDQEVLLAYTAEAVRQFGWVSRTKAKESPEHTLATIDIVIINFDQIRRKPDSKDIFHPTDDSWQEAKDALAWATGEWAESEDSSDYKSNLLIALKAQGVAFQNAPLVASLIGAYRRDLRQKSQAGIEFTQDYVGEIGERIRDLPVRLFEFRQVGMFDSFYLYKFRVTEGEHEGCQCIWMTSSGDSEEGDYLLTGTVKAHEEYQSCKQTKLSRVILKTH